MKNNPLKAVGLELAVLMFCAWQAADLITAWRHSPFDRLGWLSFAVWLLPIGFGLFRGTTLPTGSLPLTAAALVVCLVGRVLDMHLIICGALALAGAALAPAGPRRFLWLIGALCWMPVTGWLLHSFPASAVAAFRLSLALASVGVWLLPLSRSPKL